MRVALTSPPTFEAQPPAAAERAIVVFGAALDDQGRPTPNLTARLERALELADDGRPVERPAEPGSREVRRRRLGARERRWRPGEGPE